MKLRYILFHLIMIVFATVQLSAQNTNPEVTNVNHSYNSGDGTITITYDIKDAEQSSVTISMFVSSDGGTTWDYDCTQVSGDVGSSVTTGTGKSITWTHDNEHGGAPNGSNFIIKIIADYETAYYETADGSPCSPATVIYESKTYNTIQIGDKCWLKENLDVGVMINSTTGGTNSDGEQTNNSIVEKYCYDNDPNNCDTYGGLYQWNEAMQYSTTPGTQGICPAGWHIPTLSEFETLRDAVGYNGLALRIVQGTGGRAGTNTSGFSALLAGLRYYGGNSHGLGSYTTFWSSTEYTSTTALKLTLNGTNSNISLHFGRDTYGFSVRCLKD